MTEQIEKTITELKAVQAKLPELRDLFWLKIDRYNETDRQRGEAFDEKFERQSTNLKRIIDSYVIFIEKSFAPSAEELAKEKALQKLRTEFPGFDDWNEEAKKALLERKMNDFLETIMKSKTERMVLQNGEISKKQPARLLRVVFSDGTVIEEHKAIQTFLRAIERIKVERIEQLKIKNRGDLLIRYDKQFENKNANAVSIGNMYVNTQSSTMEKKVILDIISQRLNLNLKVEISER